MRILVTGAGGFIGGHLVGRLLADGHEVTAVSRRHREQWTQCHTAAHNVRADISEHWTAQSMARGHDWVVHLAATIGGIGYLESRHADCTQSVVGSSNILRAAVEADCTGVLIPSSACVYRESVLQLSESDVRPYAPRGGYGWAKLFTEQMMYRYREQYDLQVRIPRLGTVYGPHSPIGEAEKAPIALCRKVIEAKRSGADSIEIWGDGAQMRTFLYIDDCVDALVRLLDSELNTPVNIDGGELVSINVLALLAEEFGGRKLRFNYDTGKPQGVRCRSSNTDKARALLGWSPQVPLREGLRKTYNWVESQIAN